MKGLGYFFAAIAVTCFGAALCGSPHQFFTGLIAGMMAWAILTSDDEEDNKPNTA